jgi:NAD(P)-dependent dehydrogenase (short-subunit alcohol dehydrogenase family)
VVLLRRRRATAERPIAGRVVAITGAGRGLGRATAATLTVAGARVAIGDLDGELAELTAAQLGVGAIGLPVDVTDPASFGRFLDAVEARLGPLDVLVNNAGIMAIGPFLDEADTTARRQVDVNLHGVISGTKEALARMLPRRTGHVINIASAAGKTGLPHEATYAATKHAVVGLTDSIRYELRGTGVEVTVVMPGLANTELASGMRAGRGVRMVEPQEVADAIAEVLRVPRFAVYVPASLGPLFALFGVLPRPAQDLMGRMFQTDRVAVDVDDREREAYRRRLTDTGAEEPAGAPLAEGEGSAAAERPSNVS